MEPWQVCLYLFEGIEKRQRLDAKAEWPRSSLPILLPQAVKTAQKAKVPRAIVKERILNRHKG
jgi:hypothetical protein